MRGIPPLFRGMAKLKPIPMPIEAVLHAKRMQFAPGAVHRAVISIACHFWAGGAVLDGFDESMAQQIARIPSGHWAAIKAAVMPALADILPDLATLHATALEKRENMKRSLAAGQLKGRIVMFERRQKQKAATEQKINLPVRTPKTARRYVNESACMTPQALAALSTANEVAARFLDK